MRLKGLTEWIHQLVTESDYEVVKEIQLGETTVRLSTAKDANFHNNLVQLVGNNGVVALSKKDVRALLSHIKVLMGYSYMARRDEGKLSEVNKDNIAVVDQRYVGKYIIWVLSDNKKMRTAIMGKKGFDRFSSNDPDDLFKLWNLAKKYKGKAIPDIASEGKLTEAGVNVWHFYKKANKDKNKFFKMLSDFRKKHSDTKWIKMLDYALEDFNENPKKYKTIDDKQNILFKNLQNNKKVYEGTLTEGKMVKLPGGVKAELDKFNGLTIYTLKGKPIKFDRKELSMFIRSVTKHMGIS